MLSSDYVRISVACSNHHFPAQQSLCDEYRTVIRDALPWDFQLEYANKNFFFSWLQATQLNFHKVSRIQGEERLYPSQLTLPLFHTSPSSYASSQASPLLIKADCFSAPFYFQNSKRKNLLFSKNNQLWLIGFFEHYTIYLRKKATKVIRIPCSTGIKDPYPTVHIKYYACT